MFLLISTESSYKFIVRGRVLYNKKNVLQVSCLMAAFRKGHVKAVKWMVNHVTQFPSDQEMSRYISTISVNEKVSPFCSSDFV